MAVVSNWYGPAATHMAKGEIDFANDTIRVMLLLGSYSFIKDHETRADILSHEVSIGNGYQGRGAVLGTKSVLYDDVANRTKLFGSNVVWTPPAGTVLSAAYAAVYKDSGIDSTSWLIGNVNFGGLASADSAPFTINWDTVDGMLYFQA